MVSVANPRLYLLSFTPQFDFGSSSTGPAFFTHRDDLYLVVLPGAAGVFFEHLITGDGNTQTPGWSLSSTQLPVLPSVNCNFTYLL